VSPGGQHNFMTQISESSRYDNTVSHLFAGTGIVPNLRFPTFKDQRHREKLSCSEVSLD
jgi:hypothetical protein